MGYQLLDFGLHINLAAFRKALQRAVGRARQRASTVLRRYGLCSQAFIGLRATADPWSFRVDHCISFLRSCQASTAHFRLEPGTYCLAKGWLEGWPLSKLGFRVWAPTGNRRRTWLGALTCAMKRLKARMHWSSSACRARGMMSSSSCHPVMRQSTSIPSIGCRLVSSL
jgi:hypothetical protein